MFEEFKTKAELVKFALEKYNIKLSSKQSREKMENELEQIAEQEVELTEVKEDIETDESSEVMIAEPIKSVAVEKQSKGRVGRRRGGEGSRAGRRRRMGR